ncbi:MAG: DNA repair protein RecO [Thermodesulfovibrionales bacterium]
MLHRTEGIVLKTNPFGEADLIVSFLTPDYGLLKTFAKSPRKTGSRFGSSLEPLTHSRIAFFGKESAPLPRLTQSDIIHPFQLIRSEMGCFIKVLEIIELTFRFIMEKEFSKKIYILFLETLINIENILRESSYTSSLKRGGRGDLKAHEKALDLILVHYKIKLLKKSGYAPKLDLCGKCGKEADCFFVSQGSVLCKECSQKMDAPFIISKGVTKLYYNLLTWDTKKINRILPSKELLSELSNIIDAHIAYITSERFSSREFARSLTCHF